MKKAKFPMIEASLVLSSKEIETIRITNLLQVNPTKERCIEDWPDTIKSNPNLPEQMKPRNEWVWSIEHEKCISVNDVLKNLIETFEGKKSIFTETLKELCIEKSVQVLIHANSTSLPEVGLEVETIEFLNDIKTPIFFDIYTY